MIFLKPEDYLPKVNAIFDSLKNQVLLALPEVDVEHIGSSAIKGAISKGDLDVLVRASKDNFNEALEKILSLGFSIKEGSLRTDSLCMLVTDVFAHDVAIQLIERGSEFEDFITFRDRLNDDPGLVSKYNELKIDSVGLSPEEYRSRKSRFIEVVLAR